MTPKHAAELRALKALAFDMRTQLFRLTQLLDEHLENVCSACGGTGLYEADIECDECQGVGLFA